MSVSVLNTSASLSGKTLAKLEDSQTFTGLKSFDLGASAPFAVLSGAAKVDNLDADKLDGEEGSAYHDAGNLTGTAAAINGSLITNLNASALASGTVPIARMVEADPNADRIVFWDDSASGLRFLTLGAGLSIAGTTITGNPALDTMNGRLTLTTAVPVTTSDVTAAATLCYALYRGKYVTLYDGTNWVSLPIAELSIAVPATTTQMYDVFVDYNAGTPALALEAWTNDTTRATALTTQDGVLVLTGATGKRFVGCMRTTGVSGQTEDSETKRFVWNYYHQRKRLLRKNIATNTYTYGTNTWREMEGGTANRVESIVGWVEDPLWFSLQVATRTTAANQTGSVGIGKNSTTVPVKPMAITMSPEAIDASSVDMNGATTVAHGITPSLGYSFYSMLEIGVGGGNITFVGDDGGSNIQTGLDGYVMG